VYARWLHSWSTFCIAGGISAVLSAGAVLKYFGPRTEKWLSYGVASVSGTVLAVCSCTVLPLFAGIYRKGAGIGQLFCISGRLSMFSP